MSVETSIVVEFIDGTTDTGQVIIELDDVHVNNLQTDSDGKKSVKGTFLPTDSPVFLISYPDNIRIVDVKCSTGTVTQIDADITRNRELQGEIVAINGTDIELSYLDVNTFSAKWYGNTASGSINNSKITIDSGTFPCIGNITFPVNFKEQWQLTPNLPPLSLNETYLIVIVVYAEAI